MPLFLFLGTRRPKGILKAYKQPRKLLSIQKIIIHSENYYPFRKLLSIQKIIILSLDIIEYSRYYIRVKQIKLKVTQMMLENYQVKAVYIKKESQWALYVDSSYGWEWALSVPTLSLKNSLITHNEIFGRVYTNIHKSMQAYFYGNDITLESNETKWCEFVSLTNDGTVCAI